MSLPYVSVTAAIVGVLLQEIGQVLIDVGQLLAPPLLPPGADVCPDTMPSWVDDGSAVW